MNYRTSNYFYTVTLTILLAVLSSCSVTQLSRKKFAEIRLAPGDMVEVRFKYYPQFDDSAVIAPDGKLHLETIGEVLVSGMTQRQLERTLLKRHRELLAAPELVILIQKATSFTVYMGGHIKRPGLMRYKPDLTVAQSILQAGGIIGAQASYEIYVFRDLGSKGMKKFRIPSGKAGNTKLSSNFKLAPFDVIFVMKTGETKNHIGREV